MAKKSRKITWYVRLLKAATRAQHKHPDSHIIMDAKDHRNYVHDTNLRRLERKVKNFKPSVKVFLPAPGKNNRNLFFVAS
ncbi:MAG: hypothetical protein V4697_03820 [Patescibacteria group bacterium]